MPIRFKTKIFSTNAAEIHISVKYARVLRKLIYNLCRGAEIEHEKTILKSWSSLLEKLNVHINRNRALMFDPILSHLFFSRRLNVNGAR